MKNLLIVDDNEEILDIYSRILSPLNVKVFITETGAEAIKIAKETDLFLTLLDIHLGNGMNGATLQEQIKIISPMTINIAMSGYFESFSTIFLRASGFDDMLEKPLTTKCLHGIVNYYKSVHDRWMNIIQ